VVSMQWIAVDAIKPNARNTRTHSKKQIRQIADSITAFGFLVPILIDQGGLIIAGHGRYAAAVLLGLQEVPVIRVEGLSEAKRRALALADNKIGENAGWDRELLATELPELAETGVSAVFCDQVSLNRVITACRKDWHSAAIGALLSSDLGAIGRSEILPRRLDRQSGASVVRRRRRHEPNGGSQCQSLPTSLRNHHCL
jgi:hypothetical protein